MQNFELLKELGKINKPILLKRGLAATIEERLEQIDKEMAANATNAGKLRELSDEQQEIQQKLDEKMDRWVYLNDLAEQIENQKE